MSTSTLVPTINPDNPCTVMSTARLWPRKTRFLRIQSWFDYYAISFFSIVLAYFTYTTAPCTRLRQTEPVFPSFSTSRSPPQPRFRTQSRFKRPFFVPQPDFGAVCHLANRLAPAFRPETRCFDPHPSSLRVGIHTKPDRSNASPHASVRALPPFCFCF